MLFFSLLIFASFQSLAGRRTPVPRLTTTLTDIPASTARPAWPLTQSAALRTNALTFRNKGSATEAVDSFTARRAIASLPIFVALSGVRSLELLRKEGHVTFAEIVLVTRSSESGAG